MLVKRQLDCQTQVLQIWQRKSEHIFKYDQPPANLLIWGQFVCSSGILEVNKIFYKNFLSESFNYTWPKLETNVYIIM